MVSREQTAVQNLILDSIINQEGLAQLSKVAVIEVLAILFIFCCVIKCCDKCQFFPVFNHRTAAAAAAAAAAAPGPGLA